MTSRPSEDGLSNWICDLHIHIGRAGDRPVKITAARDLTFANIAREASGRKGVDAVGIIDCASPVVLNEIYQCLESGIMHEQEGGGIRYLPQREGAPSRGVPILDAQPTTIILAAEIETRETAELRDSNGRISHHICFFRTLKDITVFSNVLSRSVKNLNLSSQNCHMTARQLLQLVDESAGFLIPAHAFTPHKSLYGSCTRRLSDLFGDLQDRVFAVELGLSADSDLADRINELQSRTFVTNSDAHSLPKIAREYNLIRMAAPTFDELRLALLREAGRGVVANYGLDPKLGKYHRTFCDGCQQVQLHAPPVFCCTICGSENVTRGVLDRIVEIQDHDEPKHPTHRPPYHYQVPLQFLPKVGAVTLNRLLNRFGTEMNVLHHAHEEELQEVVGAQVAASILAARNGTLQLLPGGGGRYGRPVTNAAETQLRLI